jgi:small-conductance mechanosensitive channel
MDYSFFGNTWRHWASFAGIIFATLVLSWALRALLLARLRQVAQRTVTRWDDIALVALEKTQLWFLLVVGLHLGLKSMELHPEIAKLSTFLFLFALFGQLGLWLSGAIQFIGSAYTRDMIARDAARVTTVATLVFLAQVTIWIVMSLLLIGNLGYNVSALLAGLGVGGVAIALAVQNILSDLFGSLSIVMDKPFVIGDFIAVGDEMGKVEHIGLKTTRVKSLSGEQLVFSNSDLLKSRIRNFKRMNERRVQFNFGLQYDTPGTKLDRVREIIREIVSSQPDCRFERSHLANFGNLALEFETVYWVDKNDYLSYVNAHHGISVRLTDALRREKIHFAYAISAPIKEEELPHAERT